MTDETKTADAILPPAVILLIFSDFFAIQHLKTQEVLTSLGFIALLAFFGTAIAKVMFNQFVKMASAVFDLGGQVVILEISDVEINPEVENADFN